MVDAAFFRKMNPNNSRPTNLDAFDPVGHWEQLDLVSDDDASYVSFDRASSAPSSDLVSEIFLYEAEGSMADENLLIYCPTVPGFSLKDKLWGKSHSSRKVSGQTNPPI